MLFIKTRHFIDLTATLYCNEIPLENVGYVWPYCSTVKLQKKMSCDKSEVYWIGFWMVCLDFYDFHHKSYLNKWLLSVDTRCKFREENNFYALTVELITLTIIIFWGSIHLLISYMWHGNDLFSTIASWRKPSVLTNAPVKNAPVFPSDSTRNCT